MLSYIPGSVAAAAAKGGQTVTSRWVFHMLLTQAIKLQNHNGSVTCVAKGGETRKVTMEAWHLFTVPQRGKFDSRHHVSTTAQMA